jgi:hypothetical protein
VTIRPDVGLDVRTEGVRVVAVLGEVRRFDVAVVDLGVPERGLAEDGVLDLVEH